MCVIIADDDAKERKQQEEKRKVLEENRKKIAEEFPSACTTNSCILSGYYPCIYPCMHSNAYTVLSGKWKSVVIGR